MLGKIRLKNMPISDSEKIKKINEIYADFTKKIRMIENERDEKIMEILKRIEKRQLDKVREEIGG